MSSVLQAIKSGEELVNRAATSPDIIDANLDLIQAKNTIKMASKVARAEDEMTQSLLDMLI